MKSDLTPRDAQIILAAPYEPLPRSALGHDSFSNGMLRVSARTIRRLLAAQRLQWVHRRVFPTELGLQEAHSIEGESPKRRPRIRESSAFPKETP